MFAKRAAVVGGVDIVATGQSPIVDLLVYMKNQESNVERMKAAEESGIQSALAAASQQPQSEHVDKKARLNDD